MKSYEIDYNKLLLISSQNISRLNFVTYFIRIFTTPGKGYMRDSLKKKYGEYTVNDYPAYYRLNRANNVLQAINNLGFASVIFRYYPCMQWDTYFHRFLRWVPNGYDYLFGTRFKPCMLIFAFRLEAGWSS